MSNRKRYQKNSDHKSASFIHAGIKNLLVRTRAKKKNSDHKRQQNGCIRKVSALLLLFVDTHLGVEVIYWTCVRTLHVHSVYVPETTPEDDHEILKLTLRGRVTAGNWRIVFVYIFIILYTYLCVIIYSHNVIIFIQVENLESISKCIRQYNTHN